MEIVSRLPEVEGDKPRKKFKDYPIGYFHIDIAEVLGPSSVGRGARVAIRSTCSPVRGACAVVSLSPQNCFVLFDKTVGICLPMEGRLGGISFRV